MSWRHNDGYESDNSDSVEFDFFNHATVVIIDNGPKMFEKSQDSDEGTPCPFEYSLQGLFMALEKHVFSQWSSRLKIQLMDSREHGTYQELNKDLIEIMKKLLQDKDKNTEELKSIYSSSNIDDAVFYESLFDACETLRKEVKENHTKNILILTNDPDCNGCNPDSHDLDRVLEAMCATNIELIVLPLANYFNWSKFYGKLIQKVLNKSSIEDMIEEGFEDAESLVDVLDKFVQPKINVNTVQFFFGPRDSNTNILLQVRKAFKLKKLYRNAKVDPRTMREVVKGLPENDSEKVDTTGDLFVDERMWTEEFEPECGSSSTQQPTEQPEKTKLPTLKDLIKDDEFKKVLKQFGEKNQLRLLYLSESVTSAHYLNKPALIVEPYLLKTSSGFNQQIKLFQLFWKFCKDNDKVMICTYVRTPRQKMYYAQLTPDSYNGYQYFNLQFVSFNNNTRANVAGHLIRKEEPSGFNDLSIAKQVIAALSVKNSFRALQVQNSDYENKAALIKGTLLSTKQAKWEPPGKSVNWPTQEQISRKLGKELEEKFYKEYIAHVLNWSGAGAGASKRRKK